MIYKSSFNFPQISELTFNLCYVKPDGICNYDDDLPHSHNETEIYINLSGDVYFIIEKHIHHINRGSVLIIAPEVIHNCAYNDRRSPHGHYWITASFNRGDWIGKQLFGNSSKNVVHKHLSEHRLSGIESLIDKLLKNGGCNLNSAASVISFLSLLNSADEEGQLKTRALPDDVDFAVNYIFDNYKEIIYISDIAYMANVSINTLERHFANYIGKSPKRFLTECRLNAAASALKSGKSVQQVSDEVGFPDCSHFISEFTHFFGSTPKKYKQVFERNNRLD